MTSAHDHLAAGVVEDDPPEAPEWSEPSRPWVPDRLMVPNLVDPMNRGWSAKPGTDQGPLCTSGTVMTEQTVD